MTTIPPTQDADVAALVSLLQWHVQEARVAENKEKYLRFISAVKRMADAERELADYKRDFTGPLGEVPGAARRS